MMVAMSPRRPPYAPCPTYAANRSAQSHTCVYKYMDTSYRYLTLIYLRNFWTLWSKKNHGPPTLFRFESFGLESKSMLNRSWLENDEKICDVFVWLVCRGEGVSLCDCESSFAGVKTDGQNFSSGCVYSLFATKVFDHVTTPPKAME